MWVDSGETVDYLVTMEKLEIIIIIIKNEKIKVTLCENTAGALYIVSKMCVDGQRKVQGETS